MIDMRNKHIFSARILTVIFVIACLLNLVSCASKSHSHSYGDWEIVNEATCEDTGLRVHVCECGYSEEEVIPKIAHDYVVDHGYAATCTATGLTDGAHCSICDEILVEQQIISKMQHILEDIDGIRPTFTQTGLTVGKRCSVCKEIIVDQREIEKLNEEDYGYKVTIGTDEHVTVYVYTTQNYDEQPLLSNVAFSRDSMSGELLKNGSGQVNFMLVFDDEYYLKDISISLSSGYNALKTPVDTQKENTYRITKIKSDLVMLVSSQKQVEHLDFSSYTDDDGSILFSWAKDSRIKYTKVDVTANDETTQYLVDGSDNEWKFDEMDIGVSYEFVFTPYDYENRVGTSTSCSRYYNPEIKSVGFPRVEITTQNYVWPTCDYVKPPAGCIGAGIINNNYKQCIVNIYDKDNNCVYNSSEIEDYTKAKIKVRGNTSAYGEKKPYKIKLDKKADLLADLLSNRDDKSYAHKEWLLLKDGQSINQVLGSTVSKLVNMEYTPSFSYIECYVNGDYRGLYILCESVAQGNGTGDEQARCAVSDTGFVIEMDAYWWNEDLYFSTPYSEGKFHRWTFKYPDLDDLTNESTEYSYIKNYITEFDIAIMSGNESYKQFIDLSSFAKWLLAHDILGTLDAGGSNIYVTKFDNTDDSVLKMGPLWDFDSVATINFENWADIRNWNFFYYQLLVNDNEFMRVYVDFFDSIKESVIETISNNLDTTFTDNYENLIQYENSRWSGHWRSLSEAKAIALSWYEQHLEWLSSNIN